MNPIVDLQGWMESMAFSCPEGSARREFLMNRVALLGDIIRQVQGLDDGLKTARELQAKKLAACSCAATMDTPEGHEEAKIEKENEYWSPAYEDVMRRTAECIRLRLQVQHLSRSIDELELRLEDKQVFPVEQSEKGVNEA